MEAKIGYIIDADDMRKLREIQHELHKGADAQRDLGHRLWLLLNRAIAIEEGDLL